MSIDLFRESEMLPSGGLSNERELLAVCPQEFFNPENPWRVLAAKTNATGIRLSNWKWKMDQSFWSSHLLGIFAVLTSNKRPSTLSMDERLALGGWILSELLLELPHYFPPLRLAHSRKE